jgi:hypothetical protein
LDIQPALLDQNESASSNAGHADHLVGFLTHDVLMASKDTPAEVVNGFLTADESSNEPETILVESIAIF